MTAPNHREIKFRAWQPHYSLHRGPGMYAVYDIVWYEEPTVDRTEDEERILTGEVFFNGSTSSEYLEDVVLMQYTGLKDKNGVEIWEGDVLTDHSFKDDTNLTQLEVKFVKGCFVVECDCDQDHVFDNYHLLTEVCGLGDEISTSVEVIGNIYESPTLTRKDDL